MYSSLSTISDSELYNGYEGYTSHHATARKYVIPTQDILSMLPPPELIGPLGFDSLLIVPTAEEGARLLDELCNHHPITGNIGALDGQRDIEGVTPIVAFAGERIEGCIVFSEGAFNLSSTSPSPFPSPRGHGPSPGSSRDSQSSRSALPTPPTQRNHQPSLESARHGLVNHGSIHNASGYSRQPSDGLAATATPGSSSYACDIATATLSKTSSGLLDQIAEEETLRIKRNKWTNRLCDTGIPGSLRHESESSGYEQHRRTIIQGQTCLSTQASATTIPDYKQHGGNNDGPVLTRLVSSAPTRVASRHTTPAHEEHDATYEPMEGDLDEKRRHFVGPNRTTRPDKGKRPLRRVDTGDNYLPSRSTSQDPGSADATSSMLSISGNDDKPAHELTNEELGQLDPNGIAARMVPLKNAHGGLRWQCPWKVKGSQLCHQRCKSIGDMKRHLMTKGHQGNGFRCEHCLKTFTRGDALRRHQIRTCKGLNPENEEDDDDSRSRTTRSAQRGRPY